MPLLEILALAAGIVYGYLNPGKEDRFELFKKAVIFGIIFGFIFTILGIFINLEFLLFSSIIGLVIFVEIVIIAIFFIFGTLIGDWLEEKGKESRHDDKLWK